MASLRVALNVQPRSEFGSAVSRRLRRAGHVPGVIYGAGNAATAFSVDAVELRRTFAGASMNSIFDVVIEGTGETRHAVVKDYQVHPTRGTVVHLDMHEIPLDKPIQTTVPISVTGTSPGVTRGGLLNVMLREVSISGLPMELPTLVEVDIDGMEVGDTVRVGDLTPPAGITFLSEPDAVVVAIAATRVAKSAGPADADEESEASAPAEPEAEAEPAGDGEDGGDAAESPDGDS
ncbi:MAG: 50S ribosomal protein L25 [Thermoleophilia bacterium]